MRASVASMFDLSPEVRAENARAGLALPSLSADLRAELWGALYHSLSVAGRREEAIEVEPSAREAAYASTSEVCRFMFELPGVGAGLPATRLRALALEILLSAERRELGGQGDAQARLAHVLRSWILAASDRYDDALRAIDAGVVAAQRDRQNWALRVFETTRSGRCCRWGSSPRRRSRWGRFTRAEAHLVAGALHAPSVVSLGLLKIHTADKSGALEVAEIAKIMLQARAPGVRHHALWYLALLALSEGDPMRAHGWLSFFGHEERLSMFPLYPHEVAYDAERVRIAAAVGDEELALHGISIAERRARLNPDVPSCAAAAAHTRGIWSDSAEDLSGQFQFIGVDLARWPTRPRSKTSAECWPTAGTTRRRSQHSMRR